MRFLPTRQPAGNADTPSAQAVDGSPELAASPHLLNTRWGRTLLGATAIKLTVALVRNVLGASAVLSAIDFAASIALAAALAVLVWQLIVTIRQRLLWRVRRKLILSYIFIGVVPALLIVAFFLFGGLLMFFNVSSYLFKSGLDSIVKDAHVLSDSALADIRGVDVKRAQELLAGRAATMADHYPGASLALVPASAVPAWVLPNGFSGFIASPTAGNENHLVIRSVSVTAAVDRAVVLDLPLSGALADQLRESTGVELASVGVAPIGGEPVRPVGAPSGTTPRVSRGASQGGGSTWQFDWVTFFDYTDWQTGRRGNGTMAIRVGLADIYNRLSSAQSRFGNVSLGDLFLWVLVIIGVLFLIIEFVALFMGLALARSITSSVHALFAGTERVREGDLGHRIYIETHDQLGDLAKSFNKMTANIENLMQHFAEKQRLEEELRIARQIQMSLLPQGQLTMAGLSITALCIPAREVGGDYYDFFSLGERRLGILIADVSGKGTSAAFYMAELKGLLLSLSQLHQSPKQLLTEVNRIISANLDTRSFITMTYAVIDLDAGTFTYARAGHTPLIYLAGATPGEASVLTPEGMVLGLQLEGIEEFFASVLEERWLVLGEGDLFVFFTDGVTEAMNTHGDLFGDTRLRTIIEEHGGLAPEELRERIFREIEAFVGNADQHDDMTMILLRIGQLTAPVRPAAALATPATAG